MREQLIREVEIIPLEVVVRNVAAGSLAQRLGLDEGCRCRVRSSSSTTRTTTQRPMVSEEHVTAFGWATPQEIDDIMALAIRVNDFLTGFSSASASGSSISRWNAGGSTMGDMMRIVVADEISPDSCRLWISSRTTRWTRIASAGHGRFDRGLFEVARRLGIHTEGDNPKAEGPKLVQ